MIGFIVTTAVLGVIGAASVKGGRILTEKFSATPYTKYVNPRYVAAVAAPAVCFVVTALLLMLINPPQSQFSVSNVDWGTRQGGVLGATADAVLVRTTGASVNSGLLYSTAVLSGNTYVSVLGSPWIACEVPGVLAVATYAFLAVITTLLAVAAGRATAEYEKYMAATPAAPTAG